MRAPRRVLLVLPLLLALPGCPICPGDEMRILEGNREGMVLAADLVQLEARYGDWRAGPENCGAHWFINGVEGGSAELGTIDDCGLYRAPARFATSVTELQIVVSEYMIDGCADCCPFATIDLIPVH